MDKDLVRGITFQIDDAKKLGIMRIDWAGSRGNLCNQWNPTKLLMELKTGSKNDLKKLQQELNYLQFELLFSFQRAEMYCEGTGYDKETILSMSLDILNYVIRLIPFKDSYSCIYVYLK